MDEYRWAGGKENSCLVNTRSPMVLQIHMCFALEHRVVGLDVSPPPFTLELSPLAVVPLFSHHHVLPQFTLVLLSLPYLCLTFFTFFPYKAQTSLSFVLISVQSLSSVMNTEPIIQKVTKREKKMVYMKSEIPI